jgi:hypothetical protein
MASPWPKQFAIRLSTRPGILVLIAFACAHLGAAPLLAHPTRTIVRNTARRLVVASPPREHIHQRPGRRTLGKPLAAHSATTERAVAPRAVRTFGAPAHVSDRTSTGIPLATPDSLSRRQSRVEASNRITAEQPDVSANPATLDRVHAWEQAQREAAVQSSIAAADAEVASLHASLANGPGASSPPYGAHALPTPLPASQNLPVANTIVEDAPVGSVLPSLQPLLFYDDLGRLIVPAPLYGSREVLLHQNQMADRDGLSRIKNDAGLLDLLRQRKLVPLPADATLRVDYRLPANRRYSRPWTAQFLAALARDHFTAFHSPLQVDSAVRTVQFQRRLMRTNGNAAPAAGDTASPHLTGQAIDIAKSSLSLPEIAWMRAYLQPLIDAGKIDVEEEFQQACFHISVYKTYLPATPPRVAVAVTHPSPTPAAY